jgi:hypothetical protein
MNKKIFLLLLVLVTVLGQISSQNHDYIWPFGYDGEDPDSNFETTLLDFNTFPPVSVPKPFAIDMRGTQTSICDKNGNLLAMSNGCYIADLYGNFMENGDSLNPGYYFDEFCDNTGYPAPNAAFFIPSETDTNVYYLYHIALGGDIYDGRLLRTTLDFSYNNGLGKVTEKNKLITSGLFDFFGSTKHANGRDWWILTRDETNFTNNFLRWLVTPKGVIGPEVQSIGPGKTDNGLAGSKCIFSLDGSLFIRPDRFEGIQIFDFDRCTGLLTNVRVYNEPGLDTVRSINGELSPNGRFLYFNSAVTVYQLDLWADTLDNRALETVAQYDGFNYNGWGTSFFMSQIGPDEKIYISCTTIAPYLHVIHEPNKKGTACNVEQHAIRLAGYHGFSIPYFPNYRLGALQGSPCDSLSSLSGISYKNNINVFPNPANTTLQISFEKDIPAKSSFYLFDVSGKLVLREKLPAFLEHYSISLREIPPGIYWFRIVADKEVLKIGKLMVD